MKDFLNRYMAANQHLQRQSEKELTKVFVQTVGILHDAVGERAFRPVRAVNAAAIDSIMTGLARRLEKGPIKDKNDLSNRYATLLANKEYRSAIDTGTSQETNVTTRLELAEEAFEDVK